MDADERERIAAALEVMEFDCAVFQLRARERGDLAAAGRWMAKRLAYGSAVEIVRSGVRGDGFGEKVSSGNLFRK